MKIGILTYHAVPNFGAQLQTLSTVCYLKNHGHEPIVLHWYPRDLENIYRGVLSEQRDAHRHFMEKYLPLSALCRTEADLLREINELELDAILLGSDALFKYIPLLRRWCVTMGRYLPRIVSIYAPSVERLRSNPFFGGFIPKMEKSIPVSVYAASAQNTPYEDMCFAEKKLMRSYMSNFTLLSARDMRTRKMIESVMHVSNVCVYPDPVFAFNQNVKEFIPKKCEIWEKYHIEKNYILLSFRPKYISKEYVENLAKEVRKNGYIPIALTAPGGVIGAGSEIVISAPLSPMDWYALIKYASGYIGELMHPIVVSLHNAVPCFSFDEYGITNTSAKNVIFPKKEKWTKERSKIFHILHTAHCASNWYAYASNEPLPAPCSVINKIVEFDRDACKVFSNSQTLDYQDGMQRVMKSLGQV